MINYFNKILEFFIKSDVSDSTRDEFYGWLIEEKNSDKKDEALRGLWNNMKVCEATEASQGTLRSLNRFWKRIDRAGNKVNIKTLRLWQTAAAILLLVLISSLYFMLSKTPASSDLIEQYVPIAEINKIYLPDGTEVMMNSTSTLIYPEQFTGDTRSVYLIGEANFKVAKNERQPFVVKGDDFQVTALGTEFDLKVYPDDQVILATLLSGSVEVKYNNMESSRILRPNEQLAYNKITKKSVVNYPNLDDENAWKRGELMFKSATLEEIIPVLERKYPYTFVYSVNTLHRDRFTFRFKESISLQEIMDIIVEVSGNIKYRVEDSKYFISPL